MGLINNLKDKFNKAEFTVAPQKKLKTLSKEFLDAFDLQLVFYKGNIIKGSTKVGDAEKMFDTNFGVKVQIKDKAGKICVPNEITIGQAARGEYER